MCNSHCVDWIKCHLTASEVCGKRVIEVGSFDVNGSVRPAIEMLLPLEYVGTDMRPGPGVDVVCSAENLVTHFGQHSFDIVVTICALEHIRHWKQALSNMKQICVPGGLILAIAPVRWPFHAYPNDFWRYSEQDMCAIFADMTMLEIEAHSTVHANVYVKVQKPLTFAECDLSNYRLFSIITGTRVLDIRARHYLTFHFARILLGYSLQYIDPRVARVLIYIIMGIKIKLIDPLRRLVTCV